MKAIYHRWARGTGHARVAAIFIIVAGLVSGCDMLFHGRVADADKVTPGSGFLPYDFFLVLEQPSGYLFRANENMQRNYHFAPRQPTATNPDGLPLGLAVEERDGRKFIGFSCAACHTGALGEKGVGKRTDGTPSLANANALLGDIAADLSLADHRDRSIHWRFLKNVMALGNYGSVEEAQADLRTYARFVTTHRISSENQSPSGSGHGVHTADYGISFVKIATPAAH